MIIEYLTTALQIGGAEKVVFELASGMKARGHAVSVTCLIAPTAYHRELAALGIEVRSLGLDRQRKDVAELTSALLGYRKAVRERQPEIVHAHMVHANLLGRTALAFQRPSLICTIHNTYEGGRLRDLAYRLSNWASDLDTTISEAATRRFVSAGVLPRRTLTVHSGIDLPAPLPRPAVSASDPFRWLAVGRLEPQKDYPNLLAAMAQLPDARLSIAGDGSQRNFLEELARTLKIDGRVNFLGLQTNVAELFASHDGYVLSSAWEGFGLALAEAMGAELPVVATRSGGPVEVVGEDGTCGQLVRPGDAAELARAMQTIAALAPEARLEMGQRGRARMTRLFSRGAMLDRWQQIYTQVAGAR